MAQEVNNMFSVIIEDIQCDPFAYRMDDKCQKSVYVVLNGTEIQLQRTKRVFVNNVRVELPWSRPGIVVKKVRKRFIHVLE